MVKTRSERRDEEQSDPTERMDIKMRKEEKRRIRMERERTAIIRRGIRRLRASVTEPTSILDIFVDYLKLCTEWSFNNALCINVSDACVKFKWVQQGMSEIKGFIQFVKDSDDGCNVSGYWMPAKFHPNNFIELALTCFAKMVTTGHFLGSVRLFNDTTEKNSDPTWKAFENEFKKLQHIGDPNNRIDIINGNSNRFRNLDRSLFTGFYFTGYTPIYRRVPTFRRLGLGGGSFQIVGSSIKTNININISSQSQKLSTAESEDTKEEQIRYLVKLKKGQTLRRTYNNYKKKYGNNELISFEELQEQWEDLKEKVAKQKQLMIEMKKKIEEAVGQFTTFRKALEKLKTSDPEPTSVPPKIS